MPSLPFVSHFSLVSARQTQNLNESEDYDRELVAAKVTDHETKGDTDRTR